MLPGRKWGWNRGTALLRGRGNGMTAVAALMLGQRSKCADLTEQLQIILLWKVLHCRQRWSHPGEAAEWMQEPEV